MKYWPLALVLLFCSSCFLLKDYTKTSFAFADENIELLVPKGFKSEQAIIDSATGNKERYFYYSDGASLYFVDAVDTFKQYQVIDTSRHVPKIHSRGGLIYKGQDSTERFWREIKIKNLRLGYKNVTESQEVAFDSVLNAASMKLPIH